MSKTVADLAQAIEAELAGQYDLVYVDYRDELNDEQADAIVRGALEEVWDDADLMEWESDKQYSAAWDIVNELAADIAKRWAGEDDTLDNDQLVEDFQYTDHRSDLILNVTGRDSSDWLSQLIRNTSSPLLRVNVLSEDDAYSFEEVDPGELLEKVGLPATEHNLDQARAVLDECSPEFSVLMGYWLLVLPLDALYNLPHDTTEIEVTDPHLYLGNPFSGTGYFEHFEGAVRIKRADLRTDKQAFGYSVDEIFGGLHRNGFECELKAVA